MGSSGARRVQLALLAIIGCAALGAGLLLLRGGDDGGGIRFFRTTTNAGTAEEPGDGGPPPRQADSVEAFSKQYGDPPDATAGRIRIPSISVNAPLTYRAVTGAVMPDPSGPTDVAYYDLSQFPGAGGVPGGGGNAIFGGHVDLRRHIPYAGNVEYQGPAVFWSLDQLRPGDLIEIDYDGETYRYRVASTDEFSAEDTDWGPIWSSAVPTDTITLFTCGGAFDPDTHEYSTRLVVRAERA